MSLEIGLDLKSSCTNLRKFEQQCNVKIQPHELCKSASRATREYPRLILLMIMKLIAKVRHKNANVCQLGSFKKQFWQTIILNRQF